MSCGERSSQSQSQSVAFREHPQPVQPITSEIIPEAKLVRDLLPAAVNFSSGHHQHRIVCSVHSITSISHQYTNNPSTNTSIQTSNHNGQGRLLRGYVHPMRIAKEAPLKESLGAFKAIYILCEVQSSTTD